MHIFSFQIHLNPRHINILIIQRRRIQIILHHLQQPVRPLRQHRLPHHPAQHITLLRKVQDQRLQLRVIGLREPDAQVVCAGFFGEKRFLGAKLPKWIHASE